MTPYYKVIFDETLLDSKSSKSTSLVVSGIRRMNTRQHALIFPTGVARYSWAATQCYRLLLLAAYGLATTHPLLCIVNGDDSAVFHFLSLLTLTFDL